MKEKLSSSLKEALKARDKTKADTVRSILSAIQYEEIQIGKEPLPEQNILAILKNEAKKRHEAKEFEEKAGRANELAKLKVELDVINAFLPSQLSKEELNQAIQNIISSNPGSNLGIVMKVLKEKYAGQYDGKLASELAKELCG